MLLRSGCLRGNLPSFMSTTTSIPPLQSDPRGIALFIAAALHLLIILGLQFDFWDPDVEDQSPRTMEVVLVHAKSKQAPEKADYLAQVTQQGGGNTTEKVRPTAPLPNPRPLPTDPGEAPRPETRQQLPSTPQPTPEQPLAIEVPRPNQISVVKHPQEPKVRPLPTAAQLLNRSREIARLSAEIQERSQLYAQKPRQKYITANTKEYVYASYEDSWRLKIERIGNLNYPEEAKQSGASGTLLLDVAINKDGSLNKIQVIRSSGNHILDEGAIHIVNLAAPFSPFSPEMRAKTDILHITRAWQFKNGNRLETH